VVLTTLERIEGIENENDIEDENGSSATTTATTTPANSINSFFHESSWISM